MINKLYFILLLICVNAFSQPIEINNYTWAVAPDFKPVPTAFEEYPAVVLKDYRLFDIGEMVHNSTVVRHMAIKILKPEAIDRYNKVSIGAQSVNEYLDLKARVIKPDGAIIELPESRIIEKEEGKDRMFVFEGVETGDILEYHYTIRNRPELFGEEYFQREIPVIDGLFQMRELVLGVTHIFPSNGMKKVKTPKFASYAVSNLAPYKDEMSSAPKLYSAKVYYFLSGAVLYDWFMYYNSVVYYADGDKATSMVQNFIKTMQLNDTSLSTDARIVKMDVYIKENLELAAQEKYKSVFETHKISPKMLLNLYKDVLDKLKIPYQLIVTTNKFNDVFVREKPVPNTLSEILIYIPETKKYLSPFEYWMPYGLPDSATIGNEAIYYYTVENNEMRFDFTTVGAVSMNDNVISTQSNVAIDDEMAVVSVKKKSVFWGYPAYYYRHVLKNMKQDQLKKLIADVVFSETDITVLNLECENVDYKFNYGPDKPITFNTDVQVNESWIENAGADYLFSIGKVLGKQPNLFQETDRTMPIDLNYPKKFLHSITFSIPKGYKVKNADKLKFSKKLTNDKGEVIGNFVSDYAIENHQLIINIEEFYNFTHLEKERYADYRALINTAYDFYQSSIMLSKE